jgi:quercetin dioxygenase-like cupin family protein
MPTFDLLTSRSDGRVTVLWIPLDRGLSFKPRHFLPCNRGRVLLLRLDPGTVFPRHRHTGEVHGLNIEGHRKLLDTGDIIGPGDYVYEPAGNVDSWMAIGPSPLTVFLSVWGAVETLDTSGQVIQSDDTVSMLETYLLYCDRNGLEPVNLSR